MPAYGKLISLIQDYCIDLGYNQIFIEGYFSEETFKEIVAIRLANANVMIRNKTDRSSHQTHIAITGEAIDFFYDSEEFRNMDNKVIHKKTVYAMESNLSSLQGLEPNIADVKRLELLKGFVTVGKRTQSQVQLSKKNSENSDFFNTLRLGLYENDLLMLLKYRNEDSFLAIGIPQTFYLDIIPNYANKYDTNTYLRIPKKMI